MKKIIYFSAAISMVLLAACTSVVKVDRSKAPKAGPAPKISIGEYQLFTLDNGLRVIVVENHKLPRVSYSINLDLDPIKEGSKVGYTELAGDLLSAGTATRSKAQIDEKVDFMGATLSTGATSVYAAGLKKHSDELLAIMSDVLLNPTFPQEEFDKVVKQSLSALASGKTNPNEISSRIGNMVKYGKDHPYGEIKSEETIKNISRQDLVNYYNNYFKPNVAYLVIVGDITTAEAKTQANKYFGGWQKGMVKEISYSMPSAPSTNQVVFVPLPGAVQSVIDITYAIDLKPGTQDAIVASMLNNVLGGNGFNTRLMQNLRESKAYTYGAYSSISADEFVGEFSAGASVRNAVTDSAITQFLYEMDRLVKEPVPDSTIQTVKNIMTGNFARSLERPQTVANFALNIEKYKLPKDYYETYLQKLNAITAADLQAMAIRLIKPSNAYITVVGNKEISEKLKAFAPGGKLMIYNPDGTEYSDLKPVPVGVTVESVLQRYIDAIGGTPLLSKIKSMQQRGSMDLGPMKADMTILTKDGKYKMSVKIGAMEMVKQVYDGKQGILVQMGNKQPLEESDLAQLKTELDLLGEINFAKHGIQPVLKGIDTFNGEEVYVVELIKADGSVATEYYSVSTGLKMKVISLEGSGEQAMMSESVMNEYATKDGMKYVKKRTQSVGQQTIVYVIDEITINPAIDDKEFVID